MWWKREKPKSLYDSYSRLYRRYCNKKNDVYVQYINLYYAILGRLMLSEENYTREEALKGLYDVSRGEYLKGIKNQWRVFRSSERMKLVYLRHFMKEDRGDA